jgi:periplasmic mercuric ion binding protein
MKTILISALGLSLLLFSCGNKTETTSDSTVPPATSTAGSVVSTSFKIWGNCEMCKETIEGSLKVEGIKKADWSPETKMIAVEFDSTKISLDQIQKNIASVGYDNEKYKGDDNAYNQLPGCCQYDRK